MNPLAEVSTRLKDLKEEKVPQATLAFLIAIRDQAGLRTPVDTGNLLNSRFTNLIELPGFVDGTVGYTAEYAKWVAAMPGKLKGQPRADFGSTRDGVAFGGGTGKGFYWDPQGEAEPDFLNKGAEAAIAEDLPGIIRSIRQ